MVNEMALICCNRVIKNLDDSALFCINCEDKTTFLFGQNNFLPVDILFLQCYKFALLLLVLALNF